MVLGAVVKGACGLYYAMGISNQIFKTIPPRYFWPTMHLGPLKDHVDRVAEEMLGQRIDLIQRHPDRHNQNSPDFYFSSFGNKYLPLGVAYRAEVPLADEAKRYFLTREIAQLKTNHLLIATLVFVVIGIATTILLHSTFPIASYLIGAVAATAGRQIFKTWNTPRLDALTSQHSTPEEIEAAKKAWPELAQRS